MATTNLQYHFKLFLVPSTSGKLVLVSILTLFHLILTSLTLSQNNMTHNLEFYGFSLSYFILLVSIAISRASPALKYFSVFIYLGFYSKICIHTIANYPMVEPIGLFTGARAHWSEFFKVSSIAALAITFGHYLKFNQKIEQFKNDTTWLQKIEHFKYTQKIFAYTLLIVFFFIFFIAYINLKLGINVSGLAAITVLPWPLNAFIGFLLAFGFTYIIAELMHLEQIKTQNTKLSYILSLAEGMLSSISIASRGTFIFHCFPIVLYQYFNRENLRLNMRQITINVAAFLICFLIAGFFVTSIRIKLYDGYKLNSESYQTLNLFEPEGDSLIASSRLKLVISQISGMFVDRWIGAEGLMAVVAYPDKDIDHILKSLTRKPKPGEQDIFERMNQSTYKPSDRYVFTSLPGPVAFFYYSGSPILVFWGLLGFAILISTLHNISIWILSNPYASSLTAFMLAISFMQFGISPRPLIISLGAQFTFLAILRLFRHILPSTTIQPVNHHE